MKVGMRLACVSSPFSGAYNINQGDIGTIIKYEEISPNLWFADVRFNTLTLSMEMSNVNYYFEPEYYYNLRNLLK